MLARMINSSTNIDWKWNHTKATLSNSILLSFTVMGKTLTLNSTPRKKNLKLFFKTELLLEK